MIKEILVTNSIEKEIQPDGSSIDIIDCYDGCKNLLLPIYLT